jgi:SAM-dependent methyltransferase
MKTRILDVGCGSTKDGDVGIDRYPLPGVDIVCDLTRLPWPIADGSFSEVRSHQFVEHLPHLNESAGEDLIFRVFDEFYRVLAPGGLLSLDTPHAAGANASAFGDLTHRRYFHPAAFSVFWDPARDPLYRRKIWQLVSVRVRRYWQLGRVSEWHLQEYAPSIFGRHDGRLWGTERRAMRLARIVGPSNPYQILLSLRKPPEREKAVT